MRRRLFLTAVSAGLLFDTSWRAGAQGRVPHLAYFWRGAKGSDGETLKGFHAGLSDFGYREGRNIVVDYYYGDGDPARLAQRAAVAVAARPDVISTFGGGVTSTVERLTRTIPIVSVGGDQVSLGLAKSLARPGGNVTGMDLDAGPELPKKWLQLLTELIPGARRIAFLRTTQSPFGATDLQLVRDAAARLAKGLAIDDYLVRDASALAATLQTIRRDKPDAILADDDVLLASKAAEIAGAGLPVISGLPEPVFAKVGWLLIYGPGTFDIVRRTGSFIDRILKGAKPGDLPIERPTRYYLTINLKAAKAFGITVPPMLLAQADQVIQ
jgi:putative tryptophan/tyrosine transport system substrate-binding protein